MPSAPHNLTATELRASYESGDLDPVAVMEDVLERTDAWQPTINAFAVVDREGALDRARASARRWEAGTPLGPLDGIPVSVKENVATAGQPMWSGTAASFDAPPQTVDGPVQQLLTKSGAARFATSVMPDYGMLSSGVSSLHGITRSPLNPAWTVGGSSSGACAAAAAQLGPIHTGSDIGGSVRLPATWLGLVGFKPTYGLIPVDAPYIGRCIGPLTRTVDDCALAMSVLTGADDRDTTQVPVSIDWDVVRERDDQSVAGLRVALQLDAGWGLDVDPEVNAIVRATAERFADGGAEIIEISPVCTPEQFDGLDIFLRMRSLLDVTRLDEEHRSKVLPFIVDWVEGAAGTDGLALMDAYQQIVAMRASTVSATIGYDLVLSPVSPVAAFPAEWPMPSNSAATSLHHIGFTAPYNFSDQPAISVNAGFTGDGRPVGIQIAGRRFADQHVLDAAKWFESHRPSTSSPAWPEDPR